MGGIGKARMIWAVIALMAVMLVASRPCSDTQPGWLSERLSVVRWMRLGLTHYVNFVYFCRTRHTVRHMKTKYDTVRHSETQYNKVDKT
jgi:hypothetical protein